MGLQFQRRSNNWLAEQRHNGEELYYIFFKIHFPVLTIYPIIFIINEILILVRGHPFMTSTKNHVFDPLPLSTCVHMGRTPLPLCGRPHTVDMKYTQLS